MTMNSGYLTLPVALATSSGEEHLPEQPAGYVAWTWRPEGPVVRGGGPTDGAVTVLGRSAEATTSAVRVLARGENVRCARTSERIVGSRYGRPVPLSDHSDVRPPPKPVRVQAELGGRPERQLALADDQPNAQLAVGNLRTLGRVTWERAQACGWLSSPTAAPASSDATGRLDPAARP